MGGFWGVGASLTMEASPRRRRGFFSGLLQAGYPLGYLLAALAARLVLPHWGWRAMFWCGLLPAIATIYLAYKAPESKAWRQHRSQNFGALFRGIWEYRKDFVYLLVTITFMVFLSHGTQDLYPDFLKEEHNFASNAVAYLAMLYNVGGILGTIGGGYISEGLGRRKTIISALVLCIIVIPLWSFGRGFLTLAAAAFFMQLGVQAAWGVMPAHLNELSPDAVRSLFSGLLYQLGVLFASATNTIEYRLRDLFGYTWALFSFEGFTLLVLVGLFLLGPEKKGRSFLREDAPHGKTDTAVTPVIEGLRKGG
jgi:MFS transporter, SHS family, lactate transporter